MNQHFHEFPRFRDPPEPKRGPSIEGRRVTITVEEIPLGDVALIMSAEVTCVGIDDCGDGDAMFDFLLVEICEVPGPGVKITRPHPADQSLHAHVWHAVVKHVEASHDHCDRIMTLLEKAAS